MKAHIQILQETYKTLEREVNLLLKFVIINSNLKSKYVDTNCIKVNIFNYTELALINDRLTFLDENGLHYDLYVECSLKDLIDILSKIN